MPETALPSVLPGEPKRGRTQNLPWCLRPKSEGVGQRRLKCFCVSWPKQKQGQHQFPSRPVLEPRGCRGGAQSWHVAAQGRLGCLFWRSEEDSAVMGPLPPPQRSWWSFVRPGLLREASVVVFTCDFLGY